MSWDPTITAVKCSRAIGRTVWSPCSRFIAIDCGTETQILDATTLGRVKSFVRQGYFSQLLTFSAESRLLTRLSNNPERLISWDLQTGVRASVISSDEMKRERYYPGVHQKWEDLPNEAFSMTYSGCGTMFGVLFKRRTFAVIITYNVLSSASTGRYQVEGPVANIIWTHDKSIRFATFRPGSITIWEVGFTLEHPATEVESLPTPNNFDPSRRYLFLPTCSRLAFILNNSAFVWDVRHSKLLLSSVDIKWLEDNKMTFSSDGRFFACGARGPEIYLWKDSPTGYTFHQRLMSSIHSPYPLLSPDGRSIIVFLTQDLQLWHTTDPPSPLFSVPAQDVQSTEPFALGLSPDESLAVAARFKDNTATVLDLRSGVPWLTIDAGVKIYGLRVVGSTVAVVGEGKIITWNLPQRDRGPNATMNINDSIRTTIFDHPPFESHQPFESRLPSSTSISPDLNHTAIAGPFFGGRAVYLDIYNMTTGRHLTKINTPCTEVWFSPDGCKLWSHYTGTTKGWAIIKDSEPNFLKMEYLGETSCPSGGYPWASPHYYNITDDGWVLNSNWERLLWLPPHWRSKEMDRMWSGRFLALLHGQLPEPTILEY